MLGRRDQTVSDGLFRLSSPTFHIRGTRKQNIKIIKLKRKAHERWPAALSSFIFVFIFVIEVSDGIFCHWRWEGVTKAFLRPSLTTPAPSLAPVRFFRTPS